MAGDSEDKLAEGSSEAETSTEDDEELNNEEDNATNTSDSGKKKKKRRKKRKKPVIESEGSTSSDDSPSQISQADKQETERRFAKALESAKQSEDMWVLLGNANIHDAKARKLFEALKDNSSITSVNLSANHIGDEGVKALTEVLSAGGCAELINLDLRGNSLSEGAQQLLEGLHKQRKQLVIETGPMPDESAVGAAESSSGSSSKPRGRVAAVRAAKAAAEQTQQHDEQQAGQTLRELAKHNAMFRRYFQTEEEEGPGSSGDEEIDQVDELPDPEEVWGDITELLPQGQEAVPELSQKLLAVTHALEVEMSSMPSSEDTAQLHDFQPHFQAVIKELELLQQVLQLTPQPQRNQFSSNLPQPAVGSHRVWACAILHMLLLHNNLVIDKEVHKAGLLPAAIALALQHERCSALQCRAVEMLRCGFCSSVRELWRGLFQSGYGCGLQQQSGELMPPLHESLMQLANSAVKQPVGARSPVVGFVSEVANTLLQSCDTSNTDCYCSELAQLLDGCEDWQGSIEPQGAIHTLLQEQDGQLCGPPPPRPVQTIDEEDVDGQNLNIIKGSQLMQLLSRMADLSLDTPER